MRSASMRDATATSRSTTASDGGRRGHDTGGWSQAETSVYRTLYDRPTLLDLAGDVEGQQVLDASCGSGCYAEELLRRGASVTALDASPALVDMARHRLGSTASVRVHDLATPLTWVPDGRFDLVVLALVLHRLDDRCGTLQELHRVLATSGRLVLSTHHPMLDWLRFGGSYFDVERVEDEWDPGPSVTFWRRPLSDTVNELADVGFVVERLVEPQPSQEVRRSDPVAYASLTQRPAFVAMRLAKRVA